MDSLRHAPQLLGEVPDGTRGVTFQGRLFEEPPFWELAEWYLARLQSLHKRPSSRKSEASYIRAALEWLRSQGLERPVTADWKRYLDWRQHPACPNRLTASSADSHRSALQRVYRRCAEAPKPGWLMVSNPLASAFLPPYHDPGQDRPRSMAEPYITFPLLVARMPDPRAKALLHVLRWHGLRIQEALAIPLPGSRVDTELGGRVLDLNAGTLRIERQRTRDTWQHEPLKTEFSRATVRLAAPALEALRAALRWRQEQALEPSRAWKLQQGVAAASYVFPYYKDSLEGLMELHREVSPGDFKRRVRGVDGADAWHVYRHTFATEHARNGVQPERLHKLLRHRDRKTTDAYLRALMTETLEGDDIDESVQRQLERQEQALAERSSKGLTVVPTERNR